MIAWRLQCRWFLDRDRGKSYRCREDMTRRKSALLHDREASRDEVPCYRLRHKTKERVVLRYVKS